MNMLGSTARGRGKGRGRLLKVVSLQNNLMGPPTRPALKRRGGSASALSSRIDWKGGHAISNTRTGTFTATSSTFDGEPTVILALTEGRGEAAGEVGIAAISISHPSLILCQLSDSQSYINTLTKINILNPTEILIPLTFTNSFSTNRLVDKLKKQFKDIKITGVTRSTFNSNTGMEYLKRLCVPSMSSIFLVLQHKYYALSAAAALLTYTESTLYVFYAKESIQIDYQESEDSTIIDVATADRLELVASARPTIQKRYSCLLDVLNYCCTKIGVRTLRANILQPPCSVSEIEARLNCITELIEHSDIHLAVQEILTKISNIDQLLILPTILPDHAESCSERQLNYLLTLNTVLEKIEPLSSIFENSQQPFFVELYAILTDTEFVVIKNAVRTMIHQNSFLAKGEQGAIQRCFAIKSGINNVLDLMRKSYSERLEDMRNYVKTLSDKYGLALSLHNTNKKGYHIILNLNVYQKRTFKRSDVPEEFIQVEQFTNSFTMKTQLLINLSHRLEDIMSEILTMSNIIIHRLLIKTHEHMAIFFRLCEAIAKLDMLQSLAQASNTIHYTRPKFGDYLELQESYHPLLYYLCSNPVPNSIYASPDYNMNIVTGPNGSGKSIYIRQVVLLQVMAQVGCYVPAHSATFKLCDRILARVYLEDNIHYGASAFVLEMTEIKYFFTVLTNKTLIIIDEMCRSTSAEEGTALAMAICEKLLKTDAFVFFTTHYKHLANLRDLYYNIKTWQLETCSEMKNENMLLNFTYNTIPGIVSLEHYGIFLAKATWPDSIMKYVYDVIAVLKKSEKNTTIQHQKINEAARLKYDLEAEFKLLKSKKQLTRSIINEKLLNYQKTLQGIGHNAQICMDRKIIDSSIQKNSFVDEREFQQIKVLAEVHEAVINNSSILNASQYTLCPPFPNSDDLLQTFDRTGTINSSKTEEEMNCLEISFDNVRLSQIQSQSMMKLTPNENGLVNISHAISQKITPKHNFEYSPQCSSTAYLPPLMLSNKTESYSKSHTELSSLYHPSYSLISNPNHSELERSSQQEGTIYTDARDCSFEDQFTSSMSDSAKIVNFNESIASLTGTAFFMQLQNNPEWASTPIPAESLNKLKQQNSDSSKPQTNSNSVKWTKKKNDDIKTKISKSDFIEILKDVESCSEYFSDTWDHTDKEVCLQMKDQGKSEEQESKRKKLELQMFGRDDEFQEIEKNLARLADEVESNLGSGTSPDGQSCGSKIRFDSVRSSSHFSKAESLVKRKPSYDSSASKKTFLKQSSSASKVTSNSTKISSDDIKWGSTKKFLLPNLNQPTIVSSEENLVSIPSNSSSYSGCGNPSRGELNQKDPRLKIRYELQPKTDVKEPERHFILPPKSIQCSSSPSGWISQQRNNSKDVQPSNSSTSNILPSISDKNMKNRPKQNFHKDVIYEINYSKSTSDSHLRSTSRASTSKVSDIHTSFNSNRHSGLNISKNNSNGPEDSDSKLHYSERSKTNFQYGHDVIPQVNEINRSSNCSRLSNLAKPQIEKWRHRSKNRVHHGSTTSNSLLPSIREQHSNNELKGSSLKSSNDESGPNHDYPRSSGIIINDNNGLQQINEDELTNRSKDNACQGLEENVSKANQKNKITVLSNVLLKTGRDFWKVELNMDNVCDEKNCNSGSSVSPKFHKNYSRNSKWSNESKNVNHESSTNRHQNMDVLKVNYHPGDSPNRVKILEINPHGNKSSFKSNHSVEAQNEVLEAEQRNRQSEIDKARESFNRTLESLGDIHLELFSNDDSTDLNKENERDTGDEYEKPIIKNQTSTKRKRLGCTSRIASKQSEKEHEEKKRKFAPPYKIENSTKKPSTSTVSSLSKREMEKIYYEKDREIVESNNVSLYLTEIMNRPSIRQLQQAEHIVTAYKTTAGVLVVPAKKKKPRRKKFIAPLKRSCGNFDATIFSDKNSQKYEEIMNENESKNRNSRAECAPFGIVSSEVVSKASRTDVFDKSNDSFSFSDSSFFKNLSVRYDKPNRQTQNTDNRIDSLVHKYLDTNSTDQSKKEPIVEPSALHINFNNSNFNSSLFSHTTSIFKFD